MTETTLVKPRSDICVPQTLSQKPSYLFWDIISYYSYIEDARYHSIEHRYAKRGLITHFTTFRIFKKGAYYYLDLPRSMAPPIRSEAQRFNGSYYSLIQVLPCTTTTAVKFRARHQSAWSSCRQWCTARAKLLQYLTEASWSWSEPRFLCEDRWSTTTSVLSSLNILIETNQDRCYLSCSVGIRLHFSYT
jgi:hypothetical protein